MTPVAGRLFQRTHRTLRGVGTLCNWLRLVDLDVVDRSPLSVLGSGVVSEAEKVLRADEAPHRTANRPEQSGRSHRDFGVHFAAEADQCGSSRRR